MIYKINKQQILEETTRRPGIGSMVAAGGLLTVAAGSVPGAILGGAIGNSIHGTDGVDEKTGIIYNPQAYDDDEYDVTGALIGGLGAPVLAAGALGGAYALSNRRNKTRTM